MVMDRLPDEPVLPTESDCPAANVYVPSAKIAVVSVRVHDPDVQLADDGAVGLPSRVTVTVARSPEAVPHAPPTEVTSWLVE
jgi:hypothetical protein